MIKEFLTGATTFFGLVIGDKILGILKIIGKVLFVMIMILFFLKIAIPLSGWFVTSFVKTCKPAIEGTVGFTHRVKNWYDYYEDFKCPTHKRKVQKCVYLQSTPF